MIITAGEDYSVKIWERQSGELIRSLPVNGSEILDIAVSPDENLLSAAAKDPIAHIWDIRLEDRSPEQISALIEKCSRLQLEKGRLVSSESGKNAKALTGERAMADLRDEGQQVSSEFDNSTIPNAIATFINALQNGISSDVKNIIGKNASSRLIDFSSFEDKDFESFSDLFEGGKIQNTLYRTDHMAAIVLLNTNRGRLDILMEEELGGWRIVDIHGRPPANHSNYQP